MSESHREVGNGDPAVQAATAVFAEYGDFIRAVIRFQAGYKLDHEDLYQGFYLALIGKPLAADVQNFRSYLYRAVLNYVISAIRHDEKHEQAEKKYARNTEISINTRPATNAFIDEEQKHATVTRLAGQLQQREAQAFVLKYRDDCSVLEIAVRMGVNRRTVSRYLSESIKKLHRRLAPE